MNRLLLNQFPALLRREILENQALFVGAPVILALLLFVVSAWVLSLLPGREIATGVEYLANLFDGLSPFEMAPLLMILSLPFLSVLLICGVLYLVNALYQDRKDGSVFFWQSMPVSNTTNVLVKIVTIGAVAPLFYVVTLAVLYLATIIWLAFLGFSQGVEIAGLGSLLLAALVSVMLVYLSVILATLWLLPSIGWLLLFSAYARRTPLLWAIGIFFLVAFLEDFVFGSQFLANWIITRSDPSTYILTEVSSIFSRVFNYEMLFGLLAGSVLVSGAVFMRRFVD